MAGWCDFPVTGGDSSRYIYTATIMALEALIVGVEMCWLRF